MGPTDYGTAGKFIAVITPSKGTKIHCVKLSFNSMQFFITESVASEIKTVLGGRFKLLVQEDALLLVPAASFPA